MLFQSTLPSQGATNSEEMENVESTISIHAPLTGSDINKNIIDTAYIISIHAPLTGSDKQSSVATTGLSPFQSTLPSQGATANIHIKFLCDLLFSTLSSKNSFTLSRFPQTIT